MAFSTLPPDHLQAFAQQFLCTYYGFLDGEASTRRNISQLYHDNCQMSYEGTKFDGKPAVAEKFNSLSSIMKMMHDISSFDVQVVNESAIIIVVLGQFKTDDQEHALGFTQTFFVLGLAGTFVILNDIFRLALYNNA